MSERIQRRIDALLDQSEEAANRDDWELSARRAREALALDETSEDARGLLTAAERMQATSGGTAEHSAPGTQHAAPLTPTPPTPTLPHSFVSGRYRVLRLLGQGGRKKVYLARDERLGREVAFAVVPGEGLAAAERERFLREAQAMARLGSSPHLVSIHDIGEDGPDLYTVQEFMAGGDVAGLLKLPSPAGSGEGQGVRALPIEQTLAIAKDVCRALAVIHAAGIVHRDLKPANVFLAADGSARVGDFGLATGDGPDRLTQHGTMLGTVAYMPPEQALGGDVTARSDLYSLGAMLYEMVTGRPPFAGDDPTAVITQHLNTPPVAPSYLVDKCPASLEKVILQLLEKDPSKRPESATAVLALLEAVNPEEASVRHSDSRPLERLARGVFVGREKELDHLRKAFDEAFAGRGGLVMLVGEPGIGKTRTTQELETYARMRGANVLWGRTHESGGAPPYWPWLQIGNQWAASGGNASMSFAPETVGELSRIFPALRQQPNFVEPQKWDDPEVGQFRLFDAYATFLQAMATQAPLVVALDDLHWADKPTLQLLQHVARELSRSRILIVGNYRDTDITRQSALSETLAVLNRESGFERIVLRGLSKDEVASYIRAKANVEPKREVLDRIFEETEGNAFFLSEVVNLLAEEGTLAKDSVSDIAIPDGVREALGRRLNRLSPETNELLQVATIIGREFNYDTLVALGDRDEDELLRLIEEAINARVIEELPQPGRYKFTHAQMQETLLAELSTTRRVRLHGQVGEALERRWGDRADQHASRLAEHFVEAAMLSPRHAKKAVRYAKLAAEAAEAQNAWAEAARLYEQCLSLVSEADDHLGEDEAALLAALARTAANAGQYRAAWKALQMALDRYRECDDGLGFARAIAAMRGIPYWAPLPAVARMKFEAVQRLRDQDDEIAGNFALDLYFGRNLVGRDVIGVELADSMLERARGFAARSAPPSLLARLELMDADTATREGRFGDAIAALRRNAGAPESSEALGSDFSIGLLFRLRGDLEEAVTSLTMVLSQRYRGKLFLATASSQIASLHLMRADFTALDELANAHADVENPYWRIVFAERSLVSGDRAAAVAVLGEPPPANAQTAPTAAAFASILLQAGRGDEARRAFDGWRLLYKDSVQRGLRGGVDFVAGDLGVIGGPGPAAAFFADEGERQALVRIICSEPGSMAARLFHGSPWCNQRIYGDWAVALDMPEDAERLYRDAMAWCQREGCPIEEGRCWQGLATVAEQRGEVATAREYLEKAGELFNRHGAKLYLDQVIAKKVELQGITSDDMRSSLAVVNTAVQAERPDLSLHAAPDGTVTLMFTDIEGSTALNVELGDDRWMEVLGEHNRLIRACIREHHGFEVKTEGDAFMVAFRSARDALRCALAIQKAFGPSSPVPFSL